MVRTRKTTAEKLAELEAREKQLKAQRQKLKATLTGQERKNDTRRKIIAGALALEHGRKDGAFYDKLNALLDEYVTKPEERALFNLPALPPQQAAAE